MDNISSYDSTALEALIKPDGFKTIGFWLRDIGDFVLHPDHAWRTDKGWDKEVFNYHSPEQIDRVVTTFYGHLQQKNFKDSVTIPYFIADWEMISEAPSLLDPKEDTIPSVKADHLQSAREKAIRDGGKTEYHERPLTLNGCVTLINKDRERNGGHEIKLEIGVSGWALSRDLEVNDEKPDDQHVFVVLCRPDDAKSLEDITVLIAEQDKGYDAVYNIGQTTLDQIIRRPSLGAFLFPQIWAAERVRELVPDFRLAAAKILISSSLSSEGQLTENAAIVATSTDVDPKRPVGQRVGEGVIVAKNGALELTHGK